MPWRRHALIAVLLLGVLAACSPVGDDDEDEPTATAAIPAVNAEGDPSTPVATPRATPRAQAVPGTPRAGVARTVTPVADDNDDPDDEDASPAPDQGGTSTVPSSDDGGASSAGSSSSDEPEPTTVVVSGCDEPEELPERTGRQNRIVADDGLRLRSGPGTTCDAITTLALETPVRVISGVVDAEDDDNDWVKVDVDGTEGWVAAEFLENPPAE